MPMRLGIGHLWRNSAAAAVVAAESKSGARPIINFGVGKKWKICQTCISCSDTRRRALSFSSLERCLKTEGPLPSPPPAPACLIDVVRCDWTCMAPRSSSKSMRKKARRTCLRKPTASRRGTGRHRRAGAWLESEAWLEPGWSTPRFASVSPRQADGGLSASTNHQWQIFQ